MNKKIKLPLQWTAIVLLVCGSFFLLANKISPGSEETIVRDYTTYLTVNTEYSIETKNRLFEFRNISGNNLIVKLTPFKYRPYLNEFDPLPGELFTKEGYDNYVEFEMKPGDIQWREFIISQVSVWKMNIEVRIKR
jgi:hypothetical protein